MMAGYFRAFQDKWVSLASRVLNKELLRRNNLRGQGRFQWLLPEEAAVAEALANVIVPSDMDAPGIDEIDVLGPPAISMLDQMIATNPEKQRVYSRGLLSFDIWAGREFGCRFAELTANDQASLFRAAQQIYEYLISGGSALSKAWRRVRGIRDVSSGHFFAAQLYPHMRGDCLQIFYTSRVSWVWLEYDGPPMDQGYPRLARRY